MQSATIVSNRWNRLSDLKDLTRPRLVSRKMPDTGTRTRAGEEVLAFGRQLQVVDEKDKLDLLAVDRGLR